MTLMTRRAFAVSALALAAGCSNGIGGDGAQRLDARVDATLSRMYADFPGTRQLADKSVGMLVMPVVTEAGLGFGGAYGRGALRVGGVTVDYYSATRASIGPQIGGQQYSHVLFFMTEDALREFRTSPGWAAGADVEYVFNNIGEALKAETTTSISPVIAVVFGQAGVRVGATIEGTKYTRIIP
ncbi:MULTISPECIES: YSC84-related protein [unclassified Rhodosalinus]|uniref:lipid-binding SYLF domain-containing protein n=1 Tax=unclassified Rhodosalinus TaxID=2630183 RepID=UPI00352548D8